jgi:uncharacterized membrane protein YagU involved in acid resistance
MMNNPSLSFLVRAALAGGLVAGTADLLYACVAYGFVGASPPRILYSIAAGWLGREAALEGGVGVALLGLVSHYLILCVAAGIYVAVANRLPVLTRRPVVCGAAFGLCVFVVMNYVVVPLSAAGGAGPSGVFLLMGLLVHLFFVGVPIALVARHFTRRKSGREGVSGRERRPVAAPPT